MATKGGKPSKVKNLQLNSEFDVELRNAGSQLVVVDFFAEWCRPCKDIKPVFEELSNKYQAAVFLKIDVDVCQDVAEKQGITAMPTFRFFKNKVKVDELKGADGAALEEKIKKWIGEDGGESGGSGVKGHVDLNPYITKSGCECLNEDNEHPFNDALTKGPGFLQSDCDEQLLISIAFNQAVKLHSLKLQAPCNGQAPKTIKLFTNQTRTMDFDSAEQNQAVQTLELTAEDVQEDVIIPLKYVKFQNILSLTLFVKDNQGNEEQTVINYLDIIGSPVDTTNMQDFKRIAGKKGESH